MPRERKNVGQGIFPEIEKAAPRGMPTLEMIKSEVKRLGFWDRDAEDIYDRWLVNGFRTKMGLIRDWKAAIRIMIRHRWLPSQQTDPPGLARFKQYKPAQLAEAERDREVARREPLKVPLRSQEGVRDPFEEEEGKDSGIDRQSGLSHLRTWLEENKRFTGKNEASE